MKARPRWGALRAQELAARALADAWEDLEASEDVPDTPAKARRRHDHPRLRSEAHGPRRTVIGVPKVCSECGERPAAMACSDPTPDGVGRVWWPCDVCAGGSGQATISDFAPGARPPPGDRRDSEGRRFMELAAEAARVDARYMKNETTK